MTSVKVTDTDASAKGQFSLQYMSSRNNSSQISKMIGNREFCLAIKLEQSVRRSDHQKNGGDLEGARVPPG